MHSKQTAQQQPTQSSYDCYESVSWLWFLYIYTL